MKIRGIILFVALMLLMRSPAVAQVDYNHPDNVYRFAESLYGERDFARAINEYERFIFLQPETVSNDTVYIKLGKAYRNAGDIEKALNSFKRITVSPGLEVEAERCFQTALTYHVARQYSRVDAALDQCPEGIQPNRNAHLLRGINLLRQRYWRDAQHHFQRQENIAPDDLPVFSRYYDIAVQGDALPRKNFILCGLFSILVPGAGKFYTGRYIDGMYSLLTIGLTGWQAYDGFSKDGTASVKGWIYGTLCGGFYIGSIYGSLVSVNIYNEDLENELLKNVDISIHVPLE
jgi:tetratricopeptide (TPR) repeat protein